MPGGEEPLYLSGAVEMIAAGLDQLAKPPHRCRPDAYPPPQYISPGRDISISRVNPDREPPSKGPARTTTRPSTPTRPEFSAPNAESVVSAHLVEPQRRTVRSR